MDTAYINIKFTPLVKSIVKCESRYSLEIVPITSCVQNIEKLEWKDIKDKIEYTVPILYKIIIMKQNYPKNRIKVYHSCIDILSSSSLSNVKLSTTSEYSLLNKPNESLDENKATVDILLNPKFKRKNDINLYLCNKNDPLESLKVLKSAVTLTHENLITLKQDINNEVLSNDFKSPEVINPIERIKTTDNKSCNINQVLMNKKNDLGSSESGDNTTATHKNKTKKMILIAPVYNTRGDSILSKNTACPFTDQFLENNLDNYTTKRYYQNQINNISFELNYLNLFNSSSLLSSYRILPEIRVFNFVQIMEREILPLKIILNDIIKKCISLNYYTLLKSRSTFDNNIASNANIKKCDLKNCLKSNRVVYSVVFHE